MSSMNLNTNHGHGKLGMKAVKSEQHIGRLTVLRASNNECSPIDDSGFCSTSSMSPAPICRQFWRAGDYEDRLISKPACQNRTGYLHIHPKFLHSNATSHKWAFGAVAELLDNSIDEIQNGATFVVVDKTSNPRDGTTALLIQDNGGGMNPEAMRRCISFGFSDKHSKTAIGQYGNGFKTSSMRLGADVVVFSRSMVDRKSTQSVGLLSYTFLTQTGQDRIVVPMVDYEFDSHTSTWNSLHDEQHLNKNLSILLEWSPFMTEAELLNQFDDIGSHGTKIIVYNLWQNDDGKLELDFESDPEDIRICWDTREKAKFSSKMKASEQHLANRFKHSLRAYLSILYLQYPGNFCIVLRGQIVEYHNIGSDLKFPQFIRYKPQNVEESVITTIGFLKEAPAVNVHGFNVYHKNRLILPFWHVVTFSDSRGRGVVGLLEANFVKPTHNKQDFEKTPVFQKLETRLKEMTQEYWDYHCGLIGYQAKKIPRTMAHQVVPNPKSNCGPGIYQPVVLTRDSSSAFGVRASSAAGVKKDASGISLPSFHKSTEEAALKRKRHEQVVETGRANRMGGTRVRSVDNAHSGDVQQRAIYPARAFQVDEEAAKIIQDNRNLCARFKEYEGIDKELNLKITKLKAEIEEARREYARMLLESKVLEKVKRGKGNREQGHV
ncbi:hypothetical protein SASPL_148637 [Salvia splendens]|uniref:Morc S5 domain-containing protein n=1 Tax=Salvia splendens TaxID=180675 RepID=A0A8X8W9P3_SALSN|nr:protein MICRORCHIDIA 6-like [Salvia splendens]KAG6390892.1 hypothetical protein SASPL_148637 [Salvia splendens]